MKILNIIGEIDVDKDFNRIFCKENKFLITPVVGEDHYFEMAGESMYYCLLKEEGSKDDYHSRKQSIIQALLERRKVCDDFYRHQSLNGSEGDTQLRSTSAVIRTLILGYKDQLIDRTIIEDVVVKHFSYYFEWNDGVWFCHDTSEYQDSGPKSHLKTKYLKKDKRNTVTLNTHFDSMTTLGLILNEDIVENRSAYEDLYNKGLISINNILSKESKYNIIDGLFQKFDSLFFKKAFKDKQNVVDKIYCRIIHPLCFKAIKPTLFFKNGFIGRDLSVMNIHVDYLLVNIVDMLRFLKGYRKVRNKDRICKLDEVKLIERIHLAVNLVQSDKDIFKYIHSNDLQKAWYVEMLYLYQDYSNKYSGLFESYRKENTYVYNNFLLD